MKSPTVFFDEPGFNDYPFNGEEYKTAYYELGELIAKRGGALFIARDQKTFLGYNNFSHGWKFSDGEFRECGAFEATMIYDKGYFKTDGHSNVLNDRALDDVCTDKWKTTQLFPSISPRTFLVHKTGELQAAAQQLGGLRIVAKPVDGQEGKGVMIGSAEEILPHVTAFPYLLQEFLDTSGGIPGIVEGIHDFRIIAVSGEPVVAYVRTPPPGQLRANVAKGGKEIPVPVAQIPAGALTLFTTVDAEFQKYPNRVYSADMGLHRDGRWMIIELNSKPGLTPMRMGPEYVRFLHLLADTLMA